ncbi:MAG: hypothetical protein K1Y36_10570 [Blastocatellia bacterium]|nr:hypothetical protein [Blastocatellia bacterium]
MTKPCPKESLIETACRSGVWDEAACTHLATCADCQELVLVAKEMLRFGTAPPVPQPNLPSAAFLWHRAYTLNQEEILHRTRRWMRWFYLAAGSVFGVGFGGWTWLHWGLVKADFVSGSQSVLAATASNGGKAGILLFWLTVLLFGFNLLWTWQEWRGLKTGLRAYPRTKD